jgi:undecaprenyl-diphosphatase
MDTANAIILGIIQGLTEFLPVSSSAHLTFAEHLFKVDPNVRVSLDVLLHLGTLLALIVFFFKRIVEIIRGLFSPFADVRKENWKLRSVRFPQSPSATC